MPWVFTTSQTQPGTWAFTSGGAEMVFLAAYLLPSSLVQLESVQPTNWNALKTEAIDLRSDFYWLEDRPFQAELACLEAAGVANRLVLVNLDMPEALRQVQDTLRQQLLNQLPA